MIHLGPLSGQRIVGTGAAVPRDLDPTCPELDTAAALAALGATHPDADRWGVDRRQWVALPEDPAAIDVEDLAVAAADRALRDAGIDVELVIVATSTPNRISAALAARVARRLGHRGASV
ncbi:MAG: hypothetical protein ABMB14_18100, partial [Myxococcota bacterium]